MEEAVPHCPVIDRRLAALEAEIQHGWLKAEGGGGCMIGSARIHRSLPLLCFASSGGGLLSSEKIVAHSTAGKLRMTRVGS